MDVWQSIKNQIIASLSLTKAVFEQHGRFTNLIFSPLSVNAFLSLIAAGSPGQTLYQLLFFLRSNSANELHYVSSQLVSFVLSDSGPDVGGPNLSFANGVWVERSLLLKDPFKHVVVGVYKALLESVD